MKWLIITKEAVSKEAASFVIKENLCSVIYRLHFNVKHKLSII